MLDFAGFCRSLYHTAVVLTIEHCVKWALHVANGPKAREMDIQKFGKEREFFDLECFSERSSVHREQFLGAEARKNESFPGAATARRSCYNVTTLLVHESAFPLSPPPPLLKAMKIYEIALQPRDIAPSDFSCF